MGDELSVLMIVSDTFRGDYIGSLGGPAATPNLDELAGQSVRFSRYQSASFPTVPTRYDYLAGKYAFISNGWAAMPYGEVPLPLRIFQGTGKALTAGVVDTPFYSGYNYHYGFHTFEQFGYTRRVGLRPISPLPGQVLDALAKPFQWEDEHPAPRTMAYAEKVLERLQDDRFFLLVDTFDPHEPWNPPLHYARRYKADYEAPAAEPPYARIGEAGMSEETLANAHAAYCGTVTMVDRAVGRLLERLDSLQMSERTVVIFTADHGFYFGEHDGLFGKMISGHPIYDQPVADLPPEQRRKRYSWLRSPLYPELTHVPFLLRHPGEAPRVERRVASAIDLAPTVLDIFGVGPQSDYHGTSLLPLLRSPDGDVRNVAVSAMPLGTPGKEVRVVDDITRYIAEWQPVTVSDGRYLLLFSRREDPIELYDLDTDFACEHNLADAQPDVVGRLHAALVDELERAGASEEDLVARS
jgi:arylsulfatase A-like enzyme